ncbi:hypothetical protein [Nostoc linckia]|uniref:hypothetical protein n=1 Tax=Nostoc linckia TaxID=92942 RepID=UPI00117FD7F4|nr:hypothetical protein [Nostoc linckia]
MQTADFHRAYWNYEANLGIGKIHHPDLGIFALLFESGSPVCNVNFLDKNQFSYYWQQYKKKGTPLTLGMQIDRDVEVIRVIKQDNLLKFPDLNLEIKLEDNVRYFRSLDGKWQAFEDDVFVEYKPCDSLINVR